MDGAREVTGKAPAQRPRRTSPVKPVGWDGLWGQPNGSVPILQWRGLKKAALSLSTSVNVLDRRSTFGPLVGSADLSGAPVHRWMAYKEGYSPRLLPTVLDHLNLGHSLMVADTFGGVATTALSGLLDQRVAEVRSVEYSPFAHFVGEVKLSWPQLDPRRLRQLLKSALAYPSTGCAPLPDLASFKNREIFQPARAAALVRAREHIAALEGATRAEGRFFLLGLAAVVEDLSGAMKDGRALRIVRDRRRRPSSLSDHKPAFDVSGVVKRALAGQWTAMIEDLEALTPQRARAALGRAEHLQGDARDLSAVRIGEQHAFPDEWASLGCFSPPYLNLIDYTEVHKLELWLLRLVQTAAEFKTTRLGTLRSHPSVRFPARGTLDNVSGPAVDFIEGASDWVSTHGDRPEVGPTIRNYFEDMLEVWREQYRILKPGGVAVCVVANSTFSKRRKEEDAVIEEWRLPILTDVLLSELARVAGFSTEIWEARDLRPRNVKSGAARESLIVARKN